VPQIIAVGVQLALGQPAVRVGDGVRELAGQPRTAKDLRELGDG
jgi:hypothetical protein